MKQASFITLCFIIIIFVENYYNNKIKARRNESLKNSCIKCHKGIEPIRDPKSEMMKAILSVADSAGFPGNDCIVCHGGNPLEQDKTKAHSGTVLYFKTHKGPKEFYPDPGSPWINEHTCGQCHSELVRTQFTSLMFTEAGKIQGVLWGFGGITKYDHIYANYDVKAVEFHQRLGTKVYKKYMEQLKSAEPQVFKDSLKQVPRAPTPEEINKNPQLSAYTYIRQECQRCHLGVKGRKKRGDYRGMGCSACHIPYSNEGLYEGNDPTINKYEPGHPLVHSIQATREAKVRINNIEYSGIPIETCTTCHNRGRRIGVSFQGLMETCYSSPFMAETGDFPPKLHTKKYLHLQPDIHSKKGMLCQDCHTSLDVHSSGNLVGTTQAAVEIECQDCHGTPDKYPWELPIGYSDEIATETPAQGKPRGVTQTLPEFMKKGTVYPKHDGYLISARGNPLGNVVKKGNKVIVYTAGGKNIELKPLKLLKENDELSTEAKTAMCQIKKHIDKLECYTCHATWAPQCYGCHIRIDYSKNSLRRDWVATGHAHDKNGLTPDAKNIIKNYLIAGDIHEERSYLRWENPPLGYNGEGRVSPVVPGCQTTLTIINKQGKPVVVNKIYKIKNVERSTAQNAIDMVPLHPHTVQKESRTCDDCHANPKSIGLGIENGKLYYKPDTNYVVDLQTADGIVIPKKHKIQFNKIENLTTDWSRFVDEEGNQLQTVGHHLSKSRAFNKEELLRISRKGVCLSCHHEIPTEDIAINLLSHVNKVLSPETTTQWHYELLNKILLISAWVQVIVPLVLIVLIFVGIKYFRRSRA